MSQHLGSSSELALSTIGRGRVDVPCLADSPGALIHFLFSRFALAWQAGPYREQAPRGLAAWPALPRGCFAGFGAGRGWLVGWARRRL